MISTHNSIFALISSALSDSDKCNSLDVGRSIVLTRFNLVSQDLRATDIQLRHGRWTGEMDNLCYRKLFV